MTIQLGVICFCLKTGKLIPCCDERRTNGSPFSFIAIHVLTLSSHMKLMASTHM